MSGAFRAIASTVSTVGVIWLTKNIYKCYVQAETVEKEETLKIVEDVAEIIDDEECLIDVSTALNEHDYYVFKIEDNLCTVKPGDLNVLLPDESEIRVNDIVKCVFHERKITNLLLETENFDNARITFWDTENNNGLIKDNIFFTIDSVNDFIPGVNRFVSCRFCKSTGPYKFRAVTVTKPTSSKFNSTKVMEQKVITLNKKGPQTMPCRLKPYYLPEEMKQIVNSKTGTILKFLNTYPIMEGCLNQNNYAEFLHILLFLEEAEHEKLLTKFSISTQINMEKKSFLIDYPLDLPLHTVTVGDKVRVKSSDYNIIYGKIISVSGNRLELNFPLSFVASYNENIYYEVDFMLNRFTYRKLHKAADKMSESIYLSRLFPSAMDIDMYIGKGDINWINSSLNKNQRSAIRNILRLNVNSYPYIIFGPPGTGKTVTITELILQIYNETSTRVLVAVPTNSAASVLCQYLINSVDENDILRLTSFHAFSSGFIPDNIKHICFLAQEEQYIDVPWIPFDKIGNHRITIGTFQTVGDLNSMPFSLGHFTHVIIDEAGQATECETLLPLTLMDESTKIILSGDPSQLGPFTKSFILKKRKLNKSLTLRLMENKLYAKDLNYYPDTQGYDYRLITKLVINYRSLPKLVDVTSKIFYNNELIAGSNVSGDKLKNITIKNVNLGVNMISNLFINVAGDECQIEGDMSYFNTKEAEEVSLLVSNLYEAGLEPANIGIITPYKLQILKISESLQCLNLEQPKLCSVEEFQGDERDVIIISLVRTNLRNISYINNFIAEAERVNVALSRAKILNIVLGKRLAIFGNALWRNILSNYEQI